MDETKYNYSSETVNMLIKCNKFNAKRENSPDRPTFMWYLSDLEGLSLRFQRSYRAGHWVSSPATIMIVFYLLFIFFVLSL